MKYSELLKEELRGLVALGTAFLVLGCICVLAAIAILVAGLLGAIPLHVLVFVGPLGLALIFFSGWAWARFVDYPFDKEMQQAAEEEEARREEAERQKHLSAH